jgi:hypothetical protein
MRSPVIEPDRPPVDHTVAKDWGVTPISTVTTYANLQGIR